MTEETRPDVDEPAPVPTDDETEALRARLAELDADQLRDLLEGAPGQAALDPQVGVTRETIAAWFPTRDQAQGVRQMHEQAQLLAFRMVSFSQEKTKGDLAEGLRHLRIACMFGKASIEG